MEESKSQGQKNETLFFADDQPIIVESEDKLQIVNHNLNKILRDYSLTISAEKSEVMAFRSKVVIDNKTIEK
jgi:hypothetical protein